MTRDEFEVAVPQYLGQLRGYARELTWDQPDIDPEDLVQETFTLCFAALETLREDRLLWPWMKTTMYREFLRLIGRKGPLTADPLSLDLRPISSRSPEKDGVEFDLNWNAIMAVMNDDHARILGLLASHNDDRNKVAVLSGTTPAYVNRVVQLSKQRAGIAKNGHAPQHPAQVNSELLETLRGCAFVWDSIISENPTNVTVLHERLHDVTAAAKRITRITTGHRQYLLDPRLRAAALEINALLSTLFWHGHPVRHNDLYMFRNVTKMLSLATHLYIQHGMTFFVPIMLKKAAFLMLPCLWADKWILKRMKEVLQICRENDVEHFNLHEYIEGLAEWQCSDDRKIVVESAHKGELQACTMPAGDLLEAHFFCREYEIVRKFGISMRRSHWIQVIDELVF